MTIKCAGGKPGCCLDPGFRFPAPVVVALGPEAREARRGPPEAEEGRREEARLNGSAMEPSPRRVVMAVLSRGGAEVEGAEGIESVEWRAGRWGREVCMRLGPPRRRRVPWERDWGSMKVSEGGGTR